MGLFIDFAVRFDKDKDTLEQLTERILYSIIIRRIKGHKPVVIFLGGDSGEGKSFSAIKLMSILLKLQDIDIKDFFEDINVYVPMEYATKLDNILHKKELKKINTLCIHEARELIKAKQWHSFLNQAVSDVNAMSRAIKRICFIIISQFIRDISTDIRYTINYYITVRRPIGKRARLFISVLWKDDKDLENVKLRKRRLRGYLIDSKNRKKLFTPKYLELSKPDSDLIKQFERKDYEAKAKLIRIKMEQLIQEMKTETDIINKKVKAMVKYYLKNDQHLHLIAKKYRGKYKVLPEIKVMHDLTDTEVNEFQIQLNEEIVKRQIEPKKEDKEDDV